MSMDPLAPKVAARFFTALRRVFDTVQVKAANGEVYEFEVLKRYGEFIVHAMLGGRGYTIVHAPSSLEVKSEVPSRKVADGIAKYLGTGPGKTLYQKVAKGDDGARAELDQVLADFKPIPGPPKRGGGKTPTEKNASFPFEAKADGNSVQRTFRSLDAALRAAIEFSKSHPGDSNGDTIKIEKAAGTAPAQPIVVMRGTAVGWRILKSALSDAPNHLVRELTEEE